MSKLMPKASVIVPNYNHARFLRQRIESVLGQTYQDFELILLDDCSTDDSQSILSEYVDNPRVRIELNEKNSGSSFKQWNKGVRLARGEYVWIAESDDYADERLLERLVGVLDEEAALTFAYCRSWEVFEDGRQNSFLDSYLSFLDADRWTADFRADGREECQDYFVVTNPVPNASAVVFRKAIYDRVGGADENLRLCGDWKLWAAMALEGRIAYLAEPLNYHRSHGETVRSKSSLTGLNTAEALEVIRGILSRVSPKAAAWEANRRSTAAPLPWEIVRLPVPLGVKRALVYLESEEFRVKPPGRLRLLRFLVSYNHCHRSQMGWRLRAINYFNAFASLITGFKHFSLLDKGRLKATEFARQIARPSRHSSP
jgi:glycosyltransferase involved in cell wall biosynthesis